MARPRIPSTSPVPSPEPTGCLGLVVRLSWLVIGPAVLFALTFKIGDAGRLSSFDVLFWAVAAGMVALRNVDIARLGGQTVNCEPAGMRDWRRYAVVVPLVAAALWGLAHTLLVGFLR